MGQQFSDLFDKKFYDQYSRQLGVFDVKDMKDIMSLRVLIWGLRGLGCEVAKNLILLNPKAVVIKDSTPTTFPDLGSNFFLRYEDCSIPRDKACLKRLQDLNPQVQVTIFPSETLDEASIRTFHVVVMTDYYDQEKLCDYNEICRRNKVGFITTCCFGLFGMAFIDFGPDHLHYEIGEKYSKSYFMKEITSDDQQNVMIKCTTPTELQPGNYIRFEKGAELPTLLGNDFEVLSAVEDIINIKARLFTNGNVITTNGVVTLMQKPSKLVFDSFKNQLESSGKENFLSVQGYTKTHVVHNLYRVLLSFYRLAGRLPRPGDEKTWRNVFSALKNEVIQNILAGVAETQISPLDSFFGALVAHQIIAFKIPKVSPIFQWFYYDIADILQGKTQFQYIEPDTRYKDQTQIFDDQFQQRLGSFKVLTVGAGALGCEIVKLFAMLGMSTGSNGGRLSLVDQDSIALSNLTRQFLFQEKHIHQSKAIIAAHAGIAMNEDLRVEPHYLEFGSEKASNVFDDEYWEGLDFAIMAVDSMRARELIDAWCIFHEKPFFEAGTEGLNCQTHLGIPNYSKTYSEWKGESEDIPVCTLKSHPRHISHTLHWAMMLFEDTFTTGSRQLRKFWADPDAFLRQFKDPKDQQARFLADIEEITSVINKKGQKYLACVELARLQFDRLFKFQIEKMIEELPDSTWTSHTKPTPLKFDLEDSTHLNFIWGSANIFATMLQIEKVTDEKKICSHLESLDYQQPDFKAQENIKFEEYYAKLLETGRNQTRMGICQITFEKDDDSNYQMKFIAAAGNLRARNYQIKEVESYEAKIIAGRIIPAISTTTSMIIGALGLEILKWAALKGRESKIYKNYFIDLSAPSIWQFCELDKPNAVCNGDIDQRSKYKIRTIMENQNTWSVLKLRPARSLQEFISEFERAYGMQVTNICIGRNIVYSENKKQDLNKSLEEIWVTLNGKDNPRKKYLLLLMNAIVPNQQIICKIPQIKYQKAPNYNISKIKPTNITQPNISLVYRHSGLKNQGNTCYMNAFLQGLFAMDCFRAAILNYRSSGSSTSRLSTEERLQSLFKQIANSNGKYSIDPPKFWKDFDFPSYTQQDSSNFGALLIASLQDPYIKSLFIGKLNHSYEHPRYQNCEGFKVPEDFSLFMIDNSNQDVKTSLAKSFIDENISDIRCGKCGVPLQRKITEVLIWPRIIRILIDSFDEQGRKNENSVPWLNPSLDSGHQLRAFVVHQGQTISAGHYMAVVSSGEESWYLCNDERISQLRDPLEVSYFT